MRKWVAAAVWLGLGVIITTLALHIRRADRSAHMSRAQVNLWVGMPPFSPDPLHYDALAHHVVFRSVLSGLVTQYKNGEYVGVLARDWKVSEDFKTWTFNLRPGLTFENGDPITPEVVLKSWIRMAYLQKKKGSESGLLEDIVGYEKLKDLSSPIEGLRVSGEELILIFRKPFPKLLDTVSFGLYSVVHPSDFDKSTGEWKDARKVTSSGAYRLKDWNENEAVLALRKDFLPELWHPRPFREVRISWDLQDRNYADIIVGASNESNLKGDWKFYGPVPSSIAYVFCQSWSHSASVFYNIDNRRALRRQYYNALKELGLNHVQSFFPLSIANIRETGKVEESLPSPRPGYGILRYRPSTLQNPIFIAYNTAIRKVGEALGIPVQAVKIEAAQVFRESEPHIQKYSLDVSMRFTGILIDDPIADIRFMFFSKEGIRLPDTDGRISKELAKENFDPQVINELLWEQAVIWPVGHFSSGVWAKDFLDLSAINLVLPPTELQWIGLKS